MGPRVGIDIGGTKLLAVRLAGGEPDAELRVPAPRDGAELSSTVSAAVSELCGGESPSAVGLGVPALVGADGVLRFSPHLPGLVGVPVRAGLRQAYPQAALWVGNDATAAGWAEATVGAARGLDDVLMVTLGTGIGGGVVAGGRLVEGANRFAGEWGHMIVDPHGPPCPCGQRGCWERFASGSGLGQLGREAAIAGRAGGVVAAAGGDPEAVRGEHVTAAAAAGDPEALEVMAAFAWWLGLGLANLANVFDPSAIVIGGGVIEAGGVLLDPLREAFSRLVEAGDQRDVRILAAALGPRAGAVGAAMLAAGNASGAPKEVH